MSSRASHATDVLIPARDRYSLTGTLYRTDADPLRVAVINSATAVPRRFYGRLGTALAGVGYTVVTYDYRGIGGSRPQRLRGFRATIRDWALLDMAGVVDWVQAELAPHKIFLIGHSVGGQGAGLLDNSRSINGMVTLSSQSGYWRLQGGEQKVVVWFHAHVTLPLLSVLFGYLPWSRVARGEDVPKEAALQWARWCRHRNYLLDDKTLPFDRYSTFAAPVLAYSFADDKWGTREAVDAMMRAYPNVERRHVEPADLGLRSIGHFGWFKLESGILWADLIRWLNSH